MAKKKISHVGKVFRGRTKYIDKETKHERNYVIVRNKGEQVSVAKLKSIKKFDEKGRNNDRALQQINHGAYGLEKPTGVDFQVFRTKRMSNKPLCITDREVFPEGTERFKLSSHDTHRVLEHTKQTKKKKRR